MFASEAPHILKPCLQQLFVVLLKREEKDIIDVALSRGISVFCRILLENRDFFFSFFHEMSQDGTNVQLFKFLDLALTKTTPKLLPVISSKKMMVLALSTLLPSTDTTLLRYAPSVVELCVSFVLHIQKKEKDSHLRKYRKRNTMIRNSPCFRAKKVLAETDKPEVTNEIQFFLERLKESYQLNGPSFQQQLMQNLKNSTLDFLQQPPQKKD